MACSDCARRDALLGQCNLDRAEQRDRIVELERDLEECKSINSAANLGMGLLQDENTRLREALVGAHEIV